MHWPRGRVIIVWTQKGCSDSWDVVIGRIGVVSYHLQSLCGALELTFLCAFVCMVRYFDASMRETLLYK